MASSRSYNCIRCISRASCRQYTTSSSRLDWTSHFTQKAQPRPMHESSKSPYLNPRPAQPKPSLKTQNRSPTQSSLNYPGHSAHPSHGPQASHSIPTVEPTDSPIKFFDLDANDPSAVPVPTSMHSDIAEMEAMKRELRELKSDLEKTMGRDSIKETILSAVEDPKDREEMRQEIDGRLRFFDSLRIPMPRFVLEKGKKRAAGRKKKERLMRITKPRLDHLNSVLRAASLRGSEPNSRKALWRAYVRYSMLFVSTSPHHTQSLSPISEKSWEVIWRSQDVEGFVKDGSGSGFKKAAEVVNRQREERLGLLRKHMRMVRLVPFDEREEWSKQNRELKELELKETSAF
ncbi:hypothetical protein M501DRAFT_53683 [Patellaria atrata CBS 101060]|uniref:Uncharacterized protein n=1 Tax=Patellaria atrata CBS 101060 TaxID=1346257 RepID=A0A9P4VVH0_9PEZI|nr:hypothetical protein M501DRAFT_53683 [Patellaria atrata CBS 101060]